MLGSPRVLPFPTEQMTRESILVSHTDRQNLLNFSPATKSTNPALTRHCRGCPSPFANIMANLERDVVAGNSPSLSRGARRRDVYKSNPFVASDSPTSRESVDQNVSKYLVRQKFRQQCQEAMARDRRRDRAKRLRSSRSGKNALSGSSPPKDNMSGSDVEEEVSDLEDGEDEEVSM